MDDWVGTVVAALITALGAGLAIVVGSRLKGEWWPGDLRKAKQISEVLADLDQQSPTAKALSRQRDEALQSWAMRGRVPESVFSTLAIPFVFAGLVFMTVGFGTVLVLGLAGIISEFAKAEPVEIVPVAVMLMAVGVVLFVVGTPIAVIGVVRRVRAGSIIRKYFGFGRWTSDDLTKALQHANRVHREAKRRLRRQRAPWRWFMMRKAALPANSGAPVTPPEMAIVEGRASS
jgi:cell division protein FtsW (lipid II flippase)